MNAKLRAECVTSDKKSFRHVNFVHDLFTERDERDGSAAERAMSRVVSIIDMQNFY